MNVNEVAQCVMPINPDFRDGSFSTEMACPSHVCFPPDSDHSADIWGGPFRANKRHRNALFNHLIGTAQQRLGNCKAQRLGRLEIDDHLDFRGPLDWQVGGFLALENLTSVDADETVCVRKAASVAYKATRRGERAKLVDCRHRMAA